MSSAGSCSGGRDAAAAPDGAKKLLLGRYQLGHLLGRGASAKVYHARDLLTGAEVAVKSFPNPRQAPAAAVEKEISLMRGLRHPNILSLHEVAATRTKILLVLELAAGGELYKTLQLTGRLGEGRCRGYFRQLISAVAYCHARGVYHRDIKAENLLLDDNGDLKVADFGLGTAAGRVHEDGLSHTLCGTPAYVAPEILAKRGYDAGKVDLWSCGIVLFVLAAGYLPFNDANLLTMYKKIYRGDFRCPSWFSPELASLVRRILDPNPETRISIQGIVDHPWFREGLDEGEWADMVSGEDGVELLDESPEFKEEAGRVLNAFDIIALSSGLDLSGLLGSVESNRARFVVNEPVESVSNRVQLIGKEQGFTVVAEGKEEAVPVYFEGQDGKTVAKVEFFRVADEVSVVDVKADGPALIRLLKKRFQPVGKP